MNDRDSLFELYEIISNYAEIIHLPRVAACLPYIQECFHQGCDTFLRRRLSVCRMIIDLHLPVTPSDLESILAATLCHSLIGDTVPEGYADIIYAKFADESRVNEILNALHSDGEENEAFYEKLMMDPYALMIRLTERGTLMESLYEWPALDARKYIHQTRVFFLPMCIKAKEQYPEYLGVISILMEKMRNLCIANEALLNRYDQREHFLREEILSMREENAAIRAAIVERKRSLKNE